MNILTNWNKRSNMQLRSPRLTIHEGSVKKYMDVTLQVAEDYQVRDFTKQMGLADLYGKIY